MGDDMSTEAQGIRRRYLLLICAAALVGAALTLKAAATPEPPATGLSSLSARGVPVSPSPESKQLGLTNLTLLRRTNGRAFYRATRADGKTCYAAGAADAVGAVGFTLCGAQNFPSPEAPVFAAPEVGAERTAPDDWQLFRVDGFAADGVARVAVENRDGEIVGEARVVDNVFAIVPSHGGGIGTLTAYDAAGRVVFSNSYG
jgi:hypothetical protein